MLNYGWLRKPEYNTYLVEKHKLTRKATLLVLQFYMTLKMVRRRKKGIDENFSFFVAQVEMSTQFPFLLQDSRSILLLVWAGICWKESFQRKRDQSNDFGGAFYSTTTLAHALIWAIGIENNRSKVLSSRY